MADANKIPMSRIKAVVAQRYGVSVAALDGPCRRRCFSRPRQLAMFLARELSGASMPKIGQSFGGRDHTTVLHALREIQARRERDSLFARDVELAALYCQQGAEHAS